MQCYGFGSGIIFYDYESGPRCYGFGSRIMLLGLGIGTALLRIRT